MHQTVLKNETLAFLDLKEGDVVFEGTGGEGGLSEEIARRIGTSGVLIVTDLDAILLEQVRARLAAAKCTVYLVNDNFRNIKKILIDLSVSALDCIVADLGLCSYQIESSGRGFSFERDEPLLMTFSDRPDGLTAEKILNTWKEESLADIIYGYGGEKNSRKIARAIVASRPFKSSGQLAELIGTLSPRSGKLNPATRTFQAIRMAVNDELGALKQLLVDGWDLLVSGGRLVTISFHEVEDGDIKRFFGSKVRAGQATLASKKAIMPGRPELISNPRSRSARLRALVKL